MLCVKIKMRRCRHHQRKTPKQQKFNVSLLARGRDRADEGTKPSKRAVFKEQAATRTAAEWPLEGTVEEKWAVMKRALTDTATPQSALEYKSDTTQIGSRSLPGIYSLSCDTGTSYTQSGRQPRTAMTTGDSRRLKERPSVPSDGPKTNGLQLKQKKQRERGLEGRRCGDASGTYRGGEGGCVHQ